MPRRAAIAATVAAGLLAVVGRCGAVEETPLGAAFAAGRLAVTANGQTVFCVDEERRAIVAFDPQRPAARRDLVAPANAALPAPVAVGCLPGDVVAAVCRSADEWSLRTYRTAPAASADPAEPLQLIRLGTASGPSVEVALAVSHARGWLAVSGLPPPLPPVLRAVVAGVRIGPLTDRGCPRPPDGLRPVAAAVSPGDDLVLALRGPEDRAEIAFFDTAGQELLRLPAGVRSIGGLTFSRGDGMLWATAAGAGEDGPAGLWRLDAALRNGRQEIRPTLVAAVAAARDVASASERTLVVVRGAPAGLVRIDPVAADAAVPASAKGARP